jgi:hypothetical protein
MDIVSINEDDENVIIPVTPAEPPLKVPIYQQADGSNDGDDFDNTNSDTEDVNQEAIFLLRHHTRTML